VCEKNCEGIRMNLHGVKTINPNLMVLEKAKN
jgi:hypothetical protein